MSEQKEISLVRSLAKRYLEVCNKPIQQERRDLARKKNSLKDVRPLIYVRFYNWNEIPEATCECANPLLRQHELVFRRMLFQDSLDDDFIFEPWVTVNAVHMCSNWGLSGGKVNRAEEPHGSWKTTEYPLKDLDDYQKMIAPWHEIDEQKTAERVAQAEDLFGDIITINLDRGPAYRMWSGDISTMLGYYRGIENFMLDMYDNPDGFHKLLAFMRDGILRTHDQAEAAGDWGLSAHENQAMPYAEELADPAANVNGVLRSELWSYMAAQEYTVVSPKMHDEFLLQYQLPILKKFGLVAYGCCEDLTHKIDMLRQIPNLRRIAVAPAANVAKCAEQIGKDYVISYRPSPADMVSYGFDVERIKSIVRRDFQALTGCHYDIMLKDVETVQNDPDRLRNWVRVVRQLIDQL